MIKNDVKWLKELEAEKEEIICQITKDKDGYGLVKGGSVMTFLSNTICGSTKCPLSPSIEEEADEVSDLEDDEEPLNKKTCC